MTDLAKLFNEHVQQRVQTYSSILNDCQFDGVVISAGVPHVYFEDDQEAAFHPNPHFAHWCPESSPYHLLCIKPGDKKPTLVFYSPDDYWHEPPSLAHSDWTGHFHVVMVKDMDQRWQQLGSLSNFAFVGPEADEARKRQLIANPRNLLARLDWQRALKSPYEVRCLELANALAAKGHKAVKDTFAGFKQTGSELALHLAYLQAGPMSETDLSYNSIIGINEKSAFLHYHAKRQHVANPQTMLIDCGALYRGYCADITRTFAKDSAHPVFKEILKGLDSIQLKLVDAVKADASFLSLHKSCHEQIAELLLQVGVLKSCDKHTAVSQNLTFNFLPHGLGHMLGIQVHDVAGKQINERGDEAPPDQEFPRLRTLRPLRSNEVITIEPGIYFIPTLLDKCRNADSSNYFNWRLIDELIPFGGMRIEDNILVLKDSRENLTRKFIPF